jgi:squalene-hopene/tetraprenyl-beta-curcumene cyclase
MNSTSRNLASTSGLIVLLALPPMAPAAGSEAEPAAGPEASAPAADLAAKARPALEKGLAWLKDHQKANGSWSTENYPAMTALGLWAATLGGDDALTGACGKAAAFVAGFAQPDGGIYKPATGGRGSGGLSTYNTAICMTALHQFDRARYAPLILKARAFVAGSQLQGDSPGAGGFGYERALRGPRGRADLSNTGWALMAMRLTQELEDLRPAADRKADVDWASAVKFVEKLQNRDEQDADNFGGFGYEGGGERGGATAGKSGVVTLRGYGSMTYAGLASLIYAQVDRRDPRVQSAIQWASRHWTVAENPGMGSRGLFYYYNIMAKALSLAGAGTLRDAEGTPIPWREELVARLVLAQNPDGSWANDDNTFWENDPALVTAYACLTLHYVMRK